MGTSTLNAVEYLLKHDKRLIFQSIEVGPVDPEYLVKYDGQVYWANEHGKPSKPFTPTDGNINMTWKLKPRQVSIAEAFNSFMGGNVITCWYGSAEFLFDPNSEENKGVGSANGWHMLTDEGKRPISAEQILYGTWYINDKIPTPVNLVEGIIDSLEEARNIIKAWEQANCNGNCNGCLSYDNPLHRCQFIIDLFKKLTELGINAG